MITAEGVARTMAYWYARGWFDSRGALGVQPYGAWDEPVDTDAACEEFADQVAAAVHPELDMDIVTIREAWNLVGYGDMDLHGQ
jgi:hypothetical protein